MEKKILNIVLGGIVNRKGEILLLKRRKEPYVDHWGLPGGKIDFGENIEEAIMREIKEETDIDVKLESLVGIVHEILRKEKTNEKSMHFMIWICRLKSLHYNTKESVEGKLGWFPVKSLNKFKKIIIPSDFLMLKKFFSKKVSPVPFHKVKMVEYKTGYKIEETDL